MNANEFARVCRTEKDSLVRSYFDDASETAVAAEIRSLSLTDIQVATLRNIIDGALTDAYYTLLLALDGAASLGGVQQQFDLRGEAGAKISGDGELEAAAFEHFQES
jgi:hypothetical protein